ncbi:SMI1/KNR4 family protein [Kribbella jiaozuonensis]|uniref:SMI1/KNR4 family protein n=2 Tax=Kribbella jiaozuonensis TaxID=2575441 RepID=A0A4U3M0U3_9ACTN|nr:SMI1/KNR4 family protein [Kribbella jiaozuonensis]
MEATAAVVQVDHDADRAVADPPGGDARAFSSHRTDLRLWHSAEVMNGSVAQSWSSITGWLAERLPHGLEHLHPPATPAEISGLRAAMGRRLPSDLIAWLGLNNGFGWQANFGLLIPFLYVPMGIEQMLRDREMLRGITARVSPDRPLSNERDPAGTDSFDWLDAFLPIGDAGTDCLLFVDLREGEHHGCVGTFDNESGGFSIPEWFSITEMLADVADSLTLDRPALQDHGRRLHAATPFPTHPPMGWSPYIDDGRLRWKSVGV